MKAKFGHASASVPAGLLLACLIGIQLCATRAASWGSVGENDCTSPGIRNKFARLGGAGRDWNADCKATPITINGQTFSGDDTTCDDKGLLGEWGTWNVLDTNCEPYWGSFQQDGCTSDGHRQYSSVLYNIPSGKSWQDWCSVWPADIQGPDGLTQHFYAPDRCVDVTVIGIGLNVWGQFDLADSSCCGNTGSDDPAHGELKKRKSSRLLLQDTSLPVSHAGGSASRHLLAGCPAPGNTTPDANTLITWMLTAASVAQALFAMRNQPMLGRGPRLSQNPSQFGEPTNLYQTQDNNGNLGWQVRDANFVTGAPTNQVPGSAVANFNALWVPVLEAGADQSSFITNFQGGNYLEIPAGSFTRMDSFSANLMMTTYLSGCSFVWAYDQTNDVMYFTHIQPNPNSAFPAFQSGDTLANWLGSNQVRFHGVNAPVQVFGRNLDLGYAGGTPGIPTNGNIIAARHDGGGFSIVAQVLGPTDSPTVYRIMSWHLRPPQT
ncbi:hypothetical protein ABBQ38_008835 [Trebouxia sp. C0009 RCD-2024]